MPIEKNEVKHDPPRMISSIVEGFNAVAGHIYIILFPMCLDLFFWLGPVVRVKNYFLPLVVEAARVSSAAYGEQTAGLVENTREVWSQLLDQFNLLFSLRTFPVGIPSLMISYINNRTPLGNPLVIELESGNMILIWFLVFLVTGLFLGSVYFALVAKTAEGNGRPLYFNEILKQTWQVLFLSLILIAGFALLALPVSCLLSSVMLAVPSLGAFPFFLIGIVAVWALLPLGFSPHGIFSGSLKATKSIAASVRFVRRLMSGTGMFFTLLILIGYGLDVLWATPETDNWMLLVGIIGHAFISTGLLAASFIYYNEGIKWLENTVQPKKRKKTTAVS
ncbi:MAG: hypothetical protein J7K66_01730 [Anaerolineaceae bacterium]|nr:hypothetical protein [Anaerolineaceae bacterium]